MKTSELREWQAEHAADYHRMGGLVAAIAIAFVMLGGTALYFALTI